MDIISIGIGVALGLLIDRISTKPWPHFKGDDTDPPGRRFAQSGLAVYTDHRTGLQYLGTGIGGLTPRLDSNGNHIKHSD